MAQVNDGKGWHRYWRFQSTLSKGAAVIAAANAGITTEDILKAADWSSDTVFKKFYYKPTKTLGLGQAMLTTQKNDNSYKLQQLICETEP